MTFALIEKARIRQLREGNRYLLKWHARYLSYWSGRNIFPNGPRELLKNNDSNISFHDGDSN